ncbi:MAG: iron-only hydrogenase system regulator [Lachnospiraceae bacterium]|nr:iron-only hydrogenase system regulator [Lachnospiraceae bacterium]
MEQTETRVAVIGIIVENTDSIAKLNDILSRHREHIIGRMGLPYEKKNISCITVVIDAAQNEINTLCGQIGKLDGVSSKAAFSNV